MSDCFFHLPKLNNIEYTSYFLNEFIPKYNFFKEISLSKFRYIQYFKNCIHAEPVLSRLNNHLKTEYNFPDIEYFSIFKHNIDQIIHFDGIEIPRYSSLNLPLSGYQNTKMIFYKNNSTTNIINRRDGDANYYDIDNLLPIAELHGTNDWVMVNSSIPHHIVGITPDAPRMTVCIRFVSNPRINQLFSGMS